MSLEAIVVLAREENHFRITRALRIIFLLDTQIMAEVRRYSEHFSYHVNFVSVNHNFMLLQFFSHSYIPISMHTHIHTLKSSLPDFQVYPAYFGCINTDDAGAGDILSSR